MYLAGSFVEGNFSAFCHGAIEKGWWSLQKDAQLFPFTVVGMLLGVYVCWAVHF